MLHPLNPLPVDVERKLLTLVDRQRELLEFAVNHTVFDPSDFRKTCGDGFADWLNEKQYTGVLNNLKQLIQCPQSEKEQVLSDFDHDQEFWLNESSFQFSFDPQKTGAHKAAKGCLNPFFEKFYRFDLLLRDSESLVKRDIFEGYVKKNPSVRGVCAFCDGSMKKDQPRQRFRDYTLEHFFQKDQHPSICLHPYNLIPCCEICQEERGNKEALELNGAPLKFGDIFHPLLRPARERVELQYYSYDLEPEDLKFVDAYLEDCSKGVAVYSQLYRVPQRWKELWMEIDDVVKGRLAGLIENHKYSNNAEVTLRDFEQMIHIAIRSLQPFTNRYAYPACRWLMWARNDPRRVAMLYKSMVTVGEVHLESQSIRS